MFRILSLDGGGARGAFLAGCLCELEAQLQTPLVQYFDLIAGTSAGGMIAILMALGYPLSTIKKLYEESIAAIFEQYEQNPSLTIKFLNPLVKMMAGVSAQEFWHSKYSNRGLRRTFANYVTDKKMMDISATRLAIPATNLLLGSPQVFKTHHLPDQGGNYDYYALDVILATTAAPTFFQPIQLGDKGIYCDGGLWANNPGIVGYTEAVKINQSYIQEPGKYSNTHEIYMLSLGTGEALTNYAPPLGGSGVKWWSRRMLELMLSAQSQSTTFYLERLLHDRFYRINFKLPSPYWARLDDYTHSQELLLLGKMEAQRHFAAVRDMFLQDKASEFIPVHLRK